MSIPKFYTPREMAEFTGWPQMRIRKLIKEEKIKFIKTGAHYYLPEDAVEEYIDRNMKKPS